MLVGEKHSCERSQGDVAHLQEHQTGEEDGPRESQEAPEKISPSHSPVGAMLLTMTLHLIQRDVNLVHTNLKSELFDTCSKIMCSY